jgi:excisionase family DNA binding protein
LTKEALVIKRVPIPEGGEGEWLSVPEVARLVGLSDFTVYGAVSRGKLPAVQIPMGRRAFYRIRREDAEVWSRNPFSREQGGPPPRKAGIGTAPDAPSWTVSQVVAATGLSRQAVHMAIQDGRLKSQNIPHGKRTIHLVKPSDVSQVWGDRCGV